MVERVETWVEHDMLGDMHVDTSYSDYKDFGGVKAPAKISQKRGGFTFFEVTVANARANPADLAQLLQAPAGGAGGRGGGAAGGPPPGGGAPGAGRGGAAQGAPPTGAAAGGQRGGAGAAAAAPASASTKLAEGVYKINGNYNSLAVEFKDHIVVIEGPQNVARGDAVIAEVKRIIPNKPIRYVVNTHPHSDHAGGLAPFVAEGATIITHQNNKEYLDKAFSAPRTLFGDSLAKANKKPKFDTVSEKKVLKDDTRTIELYHIIDKDVEKVHSDGIIVALLPKERILFQADVTLPNAGAATNPFTQSLGETVDRLKLDFDSDISVHNTNVQQTRADLMTAIGK